jgi:hypothetical protein
MFGLRSLITVDVNVFHITKMGVVFVVAMLDVNVFYIDSLYEVKSDACASESLSKSDPEIGNT